MTFALNTSHPLYSNLKMLIGVNESNALVDLVTPTRTITPVSGSAFGTGTYGRHFGVRRSGDYTPYGADLSPSFKPANNTGTLLLVLNAFTFAAYDSTSHGGAFFIGKPYGSSYDNTRSLPMLAVHNQSGKASGNSYNSSTGFQTISADMTTALAAGMFTLTRNGTTAYALYANGTTTPEVSGTALGDNTTATGEYTYIGGSTDAAMDFNIVYACWFDVVLTTTQISDLYTSLGASNAFALLASGDTTAPVLTSPTGTATGSTTASGTISTDTAEGTLYFLASTNATETAATVKAASSQSVTATGSQSVNFTGLTASTTYYAHYCHKDVAGNDSTVANSTSFTTSAGSTHLFRAGGGMLSGLGSSGPFFQNPLQ